MTLTQRPKAGPARAAAPGSHLQVPLDLTDVVLQQQVVILGEAAVLVVQLSQQVVEANGGQRVLHRHRVPEGISVIIRQTRIHRASEKNL